jgi:NTE family protein
MNIGLALSGGGFRAAGFHLGVLARLAEDKRLEEVTFISTVSGGSLVTGLIYALNDFRWPSSQEYLEHIGPQARETLIGVNLKSKLIRRAVFPVGILGTRADDLSVLLQKHWGVAANLADLPPHPRWMINTTCFETGKNWRFERFRMGDYVYGYSNQTQSIPLSDAVAASAGFPGLIGPLVFDTTPFSWFKYKDWMDDVEEPTDPSDDAARRTRDTTPEFPTVHLWDGGVYDNHGLEALHDFGSGWRQGIDFLVVSDAAGRPEPEKYSATKALMRITTDILMNQVRSLRARAIIERMVNHDDRGGFFQIGNVCANVLRGAGKEAEEIARLSSECLPEEDCDAAANMGTDIKLSQDECDLLFRHGFEVADYTLYAYNEDEFDYVGYSNSRWSP